MLRGVNRQMIEICETEHPYFERAFLVVRADCAEPEEGLRREADTFVSGTDAYGGLKLQRHRRKVKQIAFQVLTGAVGAGAGWLLHWLCC